GFGALLSLFVGFVPLLGGPGQGLDRPAAHALSRSIDGTGGKGQRYTQQSDSHDDRHDALILPPGADHDRPRTLCLYGPGPGFRDLVHIHAGLNAPLTPFWPGTRRLLGRSVSEHSATRGDPYAPATHSSRL